MNEEVSNEILAEVLLKECVSRLFDENEKLNSVCTELSSLVYKKMEASDLDPVGLQHVFFSYMLKCFHEGNIKFLQKMEDDEINPEEVSKNIIRLTSEQALSK